MAIDIDRARLAQFQQEQNRARQQQAQARAKTEQQDEAATAQTAAASAEGARAQDAAAKKKSEKDRRKIVRPMQKALWSTGTIGSETVILPLLAYPLWGLWKLADIYKTRTDKDIGLPILDEFVVPFGFVDWLQFIMGVFAIIFVVSLMAGILGLLGYFFIDPSGFSALFSLLVEIFQFLSP